jgi:hypothetical protein
MQTEYCSVPLLCGTSRKCVIVCASVKDNSTGPKSTFLYWEVPTEIDISLSDASKSDMINGITDTATIS